MKLTRLVLSITVTLGVIALTSLVYGKEPSFMSSRVEDDLKRYYEDSKSEPPWRDALVALSLRDVTKPSEAATYLSALLEQALSDERSGAAPWRATPFWGSSGENPSRILRTQVLSSLSGGKVPEAALPVLRYYLDDEPLSSLQEKAAKALSGLDTKEAKELRASLASAHLNALVVTEVLTQIQRKKETLPAATLAALCAHHRASIRDAARALNKQQGGAAPAAFDPVKALQAEPLQRLLREMGGMLIEAAPATASFVTITTVVFDTKGSKQSTTSSSGWLVKEGGDKVELLTPFGWRESYQLRAKPGKCQDYGASCTVKLSKLKLEDEVSRIKKLRAKGDPDFELSERGGLTGQFQGNAAGLYELMWGYWLASSKEEALAAQVLLPALETLYRDADALLIVQDRLGQVYGYQMLTAFVGDRDYTRAEALAKQLVAHFPQSRFVGYAEHLAKELPRRKEDFTTLKLPTPEEWQKLEPTLTRAQKIDYLAQRIRLLNCFQWGQPGGVSYYDTQFAEASGLSSDAAWGLGKGKTLTINPVLELLGPVNGFVPSGKSGFKLAISDIPQLVPYLREDWFLLTVSFWRDFHPDRNLMRSREVFAMLINELAQKDLFDPRGFEALTAKEQDERLQKILDWAKANATKSETDLLLQALEDGLRDGTRWYDVEAQARALVEKKEPKAVALMLRYLETKDASELTQQAILGYCRQLDPKAAKATATKYLKHKDQGVRLEAALLLFQAGERSDSIRVLGDVLEIGDEYSILNMSSMSDAVELLLTAGSAAAQKAAERAFSNQKLTSWSNQYARVAILQRFSAAGYSEGYALYRSMLEIKGNQLGPMTYGAPVAENFATEITELFANKDADIAEIKKKYPKAPEQIAPLKAWLSAQEKAAKRNAK